MTSRMPARALRAIDARSLAVVAIGVLLGGCVSTTPEIGGGSKGAVTGAAGGSTTANANSALERCDQSLGTLAVVEDQNAAWWSYYRSHYSQLGSTVPVLRMMIQQSNCFVVVERGQGMRNMQTERTLEQSGEMRGGSNFGKGQMVAADYSMSPSIQFSDNTGGARGAAYGLARLTGISAISSVGGSLSVNEASTTLLMIDNRSGVQLAAAEGTAKNMDFGMFGSAWGWAGGASAGGYAKTPEGKVIVAAFVDSYNQLVKSVRNYKAQTVKGGLGTGGTLGVSGGSTAASQEVDAAAAKPVSTKPAPKKK